MDIKFGDNMIIDREPWLRLMGVTEEHLKRAGMIGMPASDEPGEPYESVEPDAKMRTAIEQLMNQMDEAEALLYDVAEPAFTYEIVDVGDGTGTGTNTLPIQGISLQRHLKGCDRMVVMAVTLGHKVDQLISQTQGSKIALSVVIDCGASVMAEMAANFAEEQIRENLAAMGAATVPGQPPTSDAASAPASDAAPAPLFMTARFSPGYGDSPLEMQKEVLQLLDAQNKLGITLSKGFMMSPSKSITAIIGLADHPVTGRLATCAECVLRDKCQLVKEGKRCGVSH